jgi:excisionase family DNA binding protein
MTIEVKLSPEQLDELAERVAEKLAARRPREPLAMLSLREAADVAHLHVRTMRKHIEAGRLPATRLGHTWRVRRDDLERFLAVGTDAA